MSSLQRCPHFGDFQSGIMFSTLCPPYPTPFPVSDLEYGLPVQVRDHALSIKDNLPQSDVNKEYYLQNVDNQVRQGGDMAW